MLHGQFRQAAFGCQIQKKEILFSFDFQATLCCVDRMSDYFLASLLANAASPCWVKESQLQVCFSNSTSVADIFAGRQRLATVANTVLEDKRGLFLSLVQFAHVSPWLSSVIPPFSPCLCLHYPDFFFISESQFDLCCRTIPHPFSPQAKQTVFFSPCSRSFIQFYACGVHIYTVTEKERAKPKTMKCMLKKKKR